MDFSRLVVENGISGSDHVVLRLRGELDMSQSGALRERLVAEAGRTRLLAVDLSELDFIDSSGFLALHHAHTVAEEAGGRFVLVSPSATVSRIVALMGFDHLDFTDDRSLLEERAAADGDA